MIIVLVNTLMGFPPVVAGLAIFLLLSRSGPLGSLGLLFTPKAMMIAQFVLVLPIIVALTRQTIEDLWVEYQDHLTSLGAGRLRSIPTLLWDARFSLVTTMLAGLGRASAEVGAILIVGGNIAGFTRTMTTSIALETSKGDLPLAMALGVVLMSLTLAINGLAFGISRVGARFPEKADARYDVSAPIDRSGPSAGNRRATSPRRPGCPHSEQAAQCHPWPQRCGKVTLSQGVPRTYPTDFG